MKRDAYFDNVRLVLIFFVVFGHLIQPYTSDFSNVSSLYTVIYTFHMPAFILVSGYFARGSGDLNHIKRLVKQLIIPYLIFQIAYGVFYYIIGLEPKSHSLFYPRWSLWFLLSLFSWHMLLIAFKYLRPYLGLSIAIILGMTVGYIDDIGHAFSLSRTFVFFPFFLAGYYLKPDHIKALQSSAAKYLAVLSFITIASLIYLLPEINSGWLLASKSYSDLGLPQKGAIARLLVYFTSSIMVASVLSLIPKRHFSWTYIGSKTLYIYLLHGFVIHSLREVFVFDLTAAYQVLYFVPFALLLVYVLSHRYTRVLMSPFVEVRREKL